jgi:inner membrane protein
VTRPIDDDRRASPLRRVRRSPAWALFPPAALGVILLLDLVRSAQRWPFPVVGVLDEPAHVLTAVLILIALPVSRLQPLWGWALVGSVAIDLDHIPLYVVGDVVAGAGGRPVTHSLVSVAALLALAAAFPRTRVALAGLALGVLLHFSRDVATGPGLPLLWPLPGRVELPYSVYVGMLVLATSAAVLLLVTRRTAPAFPSGSRRRDRWR